jgi:hypothetical protein
MYGATSPACVSRVLTVDSTTRWEARSNSAGGDVRDDSGLRLISVGMVFKVELPCDKV